MEQVYENYDNRFPLIVAGAAAVKIWSSDGNSYDTHALLQAALKTPYGQIDTTEGRFIQHLTVTHDNAAGAAGAGILIAINTETTPGSQLAFEYYLPPNGILYIPGPIRQFWTLFTTASNVIRCAGRG